MKGILINSSTRFEFLNNHGFYKNLSDEEFLKKSYFLRFGKELNLKNPKTFNEKLQWLKLHDRNPIYTRLVDKYEVKEYIGDLIGKRYLIPTLGLWDRFDDIDLKKLPGQFVLKCTHDSGSIVICSDREKFNMDLAKKVINRAFHTNYYYHSREWPYKNVKPRIIAEEYMRSDFVTELEDYKVFVFNGKAFCVQVDYDRFTNHHRNFYTREWEYMPFTTCYPTDEKHIIERPDCLEELLFLAEKIAQNLKSPPFLRTDFYIIDSNIYFGEITFYHGSGLEKFYPEEYDRKLGDLMKL